MRDSVGMAWLSMGRLAEKTVGQYRGGDQRESFGALAVLSGSALPGAVLAGAAVDVGVGRKRGPF